MKRFLQALMLASTFLLLSLTAFAYSGDISINQQNIRFSDNNFMEGKKVRIYASVTNHSDKDLLGVVRFFDNGNQISGDQAISIFDHKTDDVFIDWTPSFGDHNISVKIYPWEPAIDNPANNWIVSDIYAVQDTDHDGITNTKDDDDDGDGVLDNEDIFPLNPKEQFDTDGDGKGNNTDEDDDNDGVPDEFDELPLDPNETTDTDKDGIGNTKDDDDDGDGLKDNQEENLKTDPIKEDSDEDKVNDKEDKFPLDPKEALDTDNDKIGNNTDTDDDNDKIKDEEDPFPLNKAPTIQLKDDPTTIGLLEKYTFDATPSRDEDGEIVSYFWDIDGEILKEGNSVTHNFIRNGRHNVKLTVVDNAGESITKEFQVNILNIRFYKQMGLVLLAILLAIAIYMKYISGAKNSDPSKKA